MDNTVVSQRSEGWPFNAPRNVAVITTRSITEDGHPILLVTHAEDDGQWQFHDGGEPKIEDARVVSLHFMVSLDPTLAEIADLPYGWIAWREKPTAPWLHQPRSRERRFE